MTVSGQTSATSSFRQSWLVGFKEQQILPRAMVFLVAVFVSTIATAQNWSQFRGPNGNGVEANATLPTQWGVNKNVALKIKLPGVGWSQPVVWNNRIFVTTAITENQEKPRGGQAGPGFRLFSREGFSRTFFGGEAPNAIYRWQVLCLDGSTGNILWKHTVREGRPSIPIHRSNTYASETPVTDGERLFAYFGMTGLFCFNLDGKPLWSKDFDSYSMQYGWGTGSSPALHGDAVFVQCDNEEESFLVSLDKETGEELWRVARNEKSNWCTPYVWKNKLRSELVTAGGEEIRSYNPENGELLWTMNASGRCASSPIANSEFLYVGSVTRTMGSSGILAAIRAGAEGDISPTGNELANAHVAWSVAKAAPQIASPLLYDGCIYALSQHGGIIRCFDAASGKQHYRRRLPGANGFTSSPWANDGKVFCLDEKGQTVVLKSGPEMEVIATNKLDEMFWSSAAVLGDRLLLRGTDHLYVIAE